MFSNLMCGECNQFVSFMDIVKPGAPGPFTEDMFFNPCKKGKTVDSFSKQCGHFFTYQHVASGHKPAEVVLPRAKRAQPRVKRVKVLVQF